MTDNSDWYRARAFMVDALVDDLYGGDGERHDHLDEPPRERYIVGILHPQLAGGGQTPADTADQTPESAEDQAPDASYDPAISFAHLRYPSTMGLTFGVAADTEAIDVQVKVDRYRPEREAASVLSEDGAASRSSVERVRNWHRESAPVAPQTIPMSEGLQSHDLTDGLQLRAVVRPAAAGVRNVTLVLVNTFQAPEKGLKDEYCWFRPQLEVSTSGQFVDRRPDSRLEHLDNDELSAELLHRHQRNLAVGHGTAVEWDESERVTVLRTTFFPGHDLHLASADRDDVPGLGMRDLASADTDPRGVLIGLVDSYEQWIVRQEYATQSLDTRLRNTAERHLDEARVAAERMRRGIGLLDGSDPDVLRAFQAMNDVMNTQRARQDMVRAGRTVPDQEPQGYWRPFQMAFVLLNLEGLADPESPERDLADVLWFPTGGGKTEAYLGLIAFAAVLRRLRGGETGGAGVTVLMRYTLRLLTLQQFERATGLMCSLENWRARQMDIRGPRFSAGLWVGMGATPNTVADARTALKKRQQGSEAGDNGDPVQLLRCPWCGHELAAVDYMIERAPDRMVVRCPGRACDFSGPEGLPVHLVDEDVYRERPTLVIGTVDKFAMLAWREHSGNLFGDSTTPPPSLIVQDELHLISGPLGTLVGLYETAVDHLATDATTQVRPKLVASTATIRRASEQVGKVFGREAVQFPPPGIDAEDSFFAVDAPAESKGTRRYVGLMAPGTSHATLLVRTYAALLQAGLELEASDEVKDAYWTLLGYFNSLRVLGSAYIQTVDDVRDRLKLVAGRSDKPMREIRDPRELTSRKRASEIPEELSALQTPLGKDGCPDVVLATNMISVGVDVDRLGLMAVMGQPQTTSEYIQATSRVGRRHPGLVFVLYNASRSRDLSHYESFTSYHRALYRQVEATGATPFAARALDRGLHGLLITLARHRISGASGEKSVNVPPTTGDIERIVEIILRRVRSVEPEAEPRVRDALEALIEEWVSGVDEGHVKKYSWWPVPNASKDGLMVPAGSSVTGRDGEQLVEMFPPTETPWATLTSLRNVDRESSLFEVRQRRNRKDDDGTL